MTFSSRESNQNLHNFEGKQPNAMFASLEMRKGFLLKKTSCYPLLTLVVIS